MNLFQTFSMNLFQTFFLPSNERGLLLLGGKPREILGPGRHRVLTWGAPCEVRTYNLDEVVAPMTPELRAVLTPDQGEEIDVPARSLGLLSVEGRPTQCLMPGRYVLWKGRLRASVASLSLEPVLGEVPAGFSSLLPSSHVEQVVVQPHECVLLFVDGVFHARLTQGRHHVFCLDREVEQERIDLREQGSQIVGQEVLTADKASVRVSLMLKYRIVDPELSVSAVTELMTSIYGEVQVAHRRHVGSVTLEQLLERRNEAGEQMRAAVAERVRSWGVEVLRVEIKDIVLPGEMKTLFNRVIEAEKQAQAQNILRREETAATRSLANTAKLLESNPTLMRLKEMETWKEIAGKVGHVTVVASPQQLGALSLGSVGKGELRWGLPVRSPCTTSASGPSTSRTSG